MVAKIFGVTVAIVFGLVNGAVAADTGNMSKDTKEARDTIAAFKKADPSLSRFFNNAAGYAVFPTITKGAVGIGGAGGHGVLFEKGKPTGKASLSQVTVGAQLGGQTYSEIIFFEAAPALDDFKNGTLALAAQVSAVAAKAGASQNAKYQNGVAVFTAGKGGLMFEASVGGQKFSFEPYPKK
jgi:lipid-binding SYLF domain-containing protein